MGSHPESKPLRLGWATRDVTPERPVILRGQFNVRISQSVRDPITVTALALDSGDDHCVMVSADRVGVPQHILDGVRDGLQSIPDLDPGKVFVSATHTHSAPATIDSAWEDQGPDVMKPSEYGAFLIERAAECVAEAWSRRAPGAVAWGRGTAVVGFNRRQVKQDGAALMYGDTSTPDFANIEGYEDHAVDLLFAYDADHDLTGVVVNLACPSQVTEGHDFVSADFWHEARCELRKRHGAGLFILPQCSAAGDQSPHLMMNQRAEKRMLALKGLYREGDDLRLAERVEIGNRIANAVDEVLPLASLDIRDQPRLAHVVKTLPLPRRWISDEDFADAQREVAQYSKRLEALQDRPTSDRERSHNFGRRRWYNGVLERYELQKTQPEYPMELHVVRLGDVAFATNSFELYLDFGIRMKARSRALQTFVVQLTGVGTYLPSARSVTGASYGSVPASNHVGPEGGDAIVEETVGAIAALFGEEA